jgi:hypothetical protein
MTLSTTPKCVTCKHCDINPYRLGLDKDSTPRQTYYALQHAYTDMCNAPQLKGLSDQFISCCDSRAVNLLCGREGKWYKEGQPRSLDGIGFMPDGSWGCNRTPRDYLNPPPFPPEE